MAPPFCLSQSQLSDAGVLRLGRPAHGPSSRCARGTVVAP